MTGFSLTFFMVGVGAAGVVIMAFLLLLLRGSSRESPPPLPRELEPPPTPKHHKKQLPRETPASGEELDVMAKALADALGHEPVERDHYGYCFEFTEKNGHEVRIELRNRGGMFSLEWRSTLLDAPPGSWSSGHSTTLPKLRDHFLDHEQQKRLPLPYQTISGKITLESAYLDADSVKVKLSVDERASMKHALDNLRGFRRCAEKNDAAISQGLLTKLEHLERQNSLNKALREERAIEIYGWLEAHLEQLLEAGEIETAEKLHLDLVDLDSDLIDALLSFSGLDDLDEHRRERLLVEHALTTPTPQLAARCMGYLSKQEPKPAEWLDLLALHASSGEMNRESGQWFERLLREAPLSSQAQGVVSALIQELHAQDHFAPSAWQSYLPHEEEPRAAFVRLLSHMLSQPMPERHRLGLLLTAIYFGLQPERYEHVLTDFSLAAEHEDSPSLMPLLREINAKLDDYQDIEPLIEPLGHLALSPVDPEERKEALRLLCGREFLDHPGPVEIFTEAMRQSEREGDHELYIYCASTIISSFKGRPEAVEALGEIILAKKTHTLYEKALDVYPREKPEHYNFLLAVEDLPAWITDRLLEDVERMERDDYEAFVPGLRALLETSTRYKVVLRVLGLVAKRDLTPFGPALIRLHGDSSFSPELRAWVGELLETWREQNAHLLGSLSLGDNEAAGALTQVSGERGGLTMRDDVE